MRYFGNALPKKVYPYSYEAAKARGETAKHRRSYKLNVECACSIRAASSLNLINGHVPIKNVREVLDDYGPERVMWVLANTIQRRGSDTRYTEDSRKWAEGFPIPKDVYRGMDYALGYVMEGCWPPYLVEFLNLAREEIAVMRQAEAQKKQERKRKPESWDNKRRTEKPEAAPKEKQKAAPGAEAGKKPSIRKQLAVYKHQEIERAHGMVSERGKEVR